MKIHYSVHSKTSGCFAIQGRFQTKQKGIQVSPPGCRLYSPASYGAVSDYFSRFHYWRFMLEDGSVQTCFNCASETELELPEGTVSYSYQVEIESVDSGKEALLRGHVSGRFLYFLGLALFPAADGIDEYEIKFDQETYSTRQGERRNFHCNNRRQLFLTGYVQGSFQVEFLSRPNLFLIQPQALVGQTAVWSGKVPLLLNECQSWFAAPAPFVNLNLFVWEDSSSTFGVGISLDESCCLALPADGDLSSTYWLLLHELLHQWIGLSIRAREPDLGWFFEGFVVYLTNLLLIRCGLDQPVIMSTAIHQMIGNVDDSGEPLNDYCAGFLLCHYFAETVGEKSSADFQQWWAELFRCRAGQAVSADELLSALSVGGPESDWQKRLILFLADGSVAKPTADSVISGLYLCGRKSEVN